MKMLLPALAVLGLALPAQALSIKEKKQYAEWVKDLNNPNGEGSFGEVQKKCGKAIPVTLDEGVTTTFMTENKSASGYCDSTLDVISSMCDDATAKKEIASKIKKISCKMHKDPTKIELKISGGTLQFTFGKDASNLEAAVKEFLENNL